jgi:hypothetical protein
MFEVVVIVFEAESEIESYREVYRECASMEEALIGQISAAVEYDEMEGSVWFEVAIIAA